MSTQDISPQEWQTFPAAGNIQVGFNGKVFMVAHNDFPKLVAWLLDEENADRDRILLANAGDQRVSEAWNVAREWAGDIATRYCINARFQQLADFLGMDF